MIERCITAICALLRRCAIVVQTRRLPRDYDETLENLWRRR